MTISGTELNTELFYIIASLCSVKDKVASLNFPTDICKSLTHFPLNYIRPDSVIHTCIEYSLLLWGMSVINRKINLNKSERQTAELGPQLQAGSNLKDFFQILKSIKITIAWIARETLPLHFITPSIWLKTSNTLWVLWISLHSNAHHNI